MSSRRYKSCEECRMTKKKCDKGDVCSRCARMGKECVYFYTWQSAPDDELADENGTLEEVPSAAENTRFWMPLPSQSTPSINQFPEAQAIPDQRDPSSQLHLQERMSSGASIAPTVRAGDSYRYAKDQHHHGQHAPYSKPPQPVVSKSRKMSVEFLID
ncbi:hypothetical protein HDU82_007744 [Entophlyctis luteolus]|nr:hypothetical protein HDU82_007744 [Entophlyctis luteolus]